MGCFLGCFGGGKSHKRLKQRINRASPQHQRNGVTNVQQESKITAEQFITEKTPLNLDSELRNKAEGVQQLNPSPKKRVTFNLNITTYEHVSVRESIDSRPERTINIEKEKVVDLEKSCRSHSISEDDNSVISSIGSYPPNHRYHNARESDDEAEDYGDSDLDDEDQYEDYDDEDIDVGISGPEVWSESFLTESMESRTGNHSVQDIIEEVESPMVKSQPTDQEVKAFGSKPTARDRSGYINSVLNPVENIAQWKTAKSKGPNLLKPQKENLTANFGAPHMSFGSEPTSGQPLFSFKAKSDQLKNSNQEMAVDASLSNWLVSSEITPSKKTSFGGLETIVSGQTMLEWRTSVRSLEDRPILGAWTVEELKQISPPPSPRKSPSRSLDEMPIVGNVGTYWNHSVLARHSDPFTSFKGTPSKYRGI